MFRTISGTADPRECSDPREGKADTKVGQTKSSDSIESHADTGDRISFNDTLEEHEDSNEQDEKRTPRPSNELKRTTSNALSRVSSHLTTRSLPDPGPPPDGGIRAWSNIAGGWIAIATTGQSRTRD